MIFCKILNTKHGQFLLRKDVSRDESEPPALLYDVVDDDGRPWRGLDLFTDAASMEAAFEKIDERLAQTVTMLMLRQVSTSVPDGTRFLILQPEQGLHLVTEAALLGLEVMVDGEPVPDGWLEMSVHGFAVAFRFVPAGTSTVRSAGTDWMAAQIELQKLGYALDGIEEEDDEDGELVPA